MFDATSARAHLASAPRIKAALFIAVDLTLAEAGPRCYPGGEHRGTLHGMQRQFVPMWCRALSAHRGCRHGVCPVLYAKTVSTISSSRSAGPGTRQNIDEFTRTTARKRREIGGAKESKSIIVINPRIRRLSAQYDLRRC